MANVRVYNDNRFEHREKFRGVHIVIPPGEYVEMNKEDAVLFKSQFTPVIRNKGGKDDPRGFKMIRIDYDPEIPETKDVVGEKSQSLTCQACGFQAKTDAGLKVHLRTHASQMVDDEAREALEHGA